MQTTGLKVLIIEDRRENIVFLANNILKPKGFEVITARDGQTGLRKALEDTPDLIITDLNLPKMSGLEIIADLRDRGSYIPFIVTTLHGSEALAVRAFRLGAKDYLVKPLKTEEVDAALARVFDASLHTHDTAQNLGQVAKLEGVIVNLEERIQQQANEIKQFQTQKQPIQDMKKRFQVQEKVLQQEIKNVEQLTVQLNEQTQSANEARNQARALMQFIIAQAKEIDRQQKEIAQLLKQLNALMGNLNKFATRIDKQSQQFQMIVPQDES